MPGSGECENYVFTAMQTGRGAAPMFKKDAAATVTAAERAEEKMRTELERTWWNGMPDADKVCRFICACLCCVFSRGENLVMSVF